MSENASDVTNIILFISFILTKTSGYYLILVLTGWIIEGCWILQTICHFIIFSTFKFKLLSFPFRNPSLRFCPFLFYLHLHIVWSIWWNSRGSRSRDLNPMTGGTRGPLSIHWQHSLVNYLPAPDSDSDWQAPFKLTFYNSSSFSFNHS